MLCTMTATYDNLDPLDPLIPWIQGAMPFVKSSWLFWRSSSRPSSNSGRRLRKSPSSSRPQFDNGYNTSIQYSTVLCKTMQHSWNQQCVYSTFQCIVEASTFHRYDSYAWKGLQARNAWTVRKVWTHNKTSYTMWTRTVLSCNDFPLPAYHR